MIDIQELSDRELLVAIDMARFAAQGPFDDGKVSGLLVELCREGVKRGILE